MIGGGGNPMSQAVKLAQKVLPLLWAAELTPHRVAVMAVTRLPPLGIDAAAPGDRGSAAGNGSADERSATDTTGSVAARRPTVIASVCSGVAMRKSFGRVLPVIVLIFAPWTRVVDAQTTTSPADVPRFELFGGYSSMPGSGSGVYEGTAHGFAASATFNINRFLGLNVDYDSHEWTFAPLSASPDVIEIPFDIRMHFLSLGPRVALRSGRLSAFGFVSMDGQWSQFADQEVIVRGEHETRSGHTSSAWGFGLGGGVDVALTRRIALRPTQVNYSLGGFGSGAGRDFRWKMGMVFRLG